MNTNHQTHFFCTYDSMVIFSDISIDILALNKCSLFTYLNISPTCDLMQIVITSNEQCESSNNVIRRQTLAHDCLAWIITISKQRLFLSNTLHSFTTFRGKGGSVVRPLATRAKGSGFDSVITQNVQN